MLKAMRRCFGIAISLFSVQIMITACSGNSFDIDTSEKETTPSPIESTAAATTASEEMTKSIEPSESAETAPAIPESSSDGTAEKETKILLYGKDTSEYGQITGWWADETINNGNTLPILSWGPDNSSSGLSLALTFKPAFFERLKIDRILISTEDGNGFLIRDPRANRRMFYYYLQYGINDFLYQTAEVTADNCYNPASFWYWDIPEDPDHPCYIDIVYLREDKAVGYSVLRGISDHTVIRFDVFHEEFFTEAALSREQALPILLAWHEGYTGPGEPMRPPVMPITEPPTAWPENPAASAAPQKEEEISVLFTDDACVYGSAFGRWVMSGSKLSGLHLGILEEYFEAIEADSIEVLAWDEDAFLCPVCITQYTYDYLLRYYERYGITDGLYKSMTFTEPEIIYWDTAYLESRRIPDHPFFINILYCRDGKVSGYSVLKGEVDADYLQITFRVIHEAAFPDGPVTRDEAMVNIMQQHENNR